MGIYAQTSNMILQLSTFAFRRAYQNSGGPTRNVRYRSYKYIHLQNLNSKSMKERNKKPCQCHNARSQHLLNPHHVFLSLLVNVSQSREGVCELTVQQLTCPTQLIIYMYIHSIIHKAIHQSTHIKSYKYTCIRLQCIILYILHFIAISYIKLRFTTYYSLFHHIRTYCMTLNYIILHYITT